MSVYKNIVCPTDFSENAEQAMRYAHALAEKSGGVVQSVHAVDVGFAHTGLAEGVYVTIAELHTSLESLKEHAREKLEKYVELEHFRGVEITPHLRVGPAAEEVVGVADEVNADLFVIGTHGRSGLDRLVFGSTCDKIVRIAKVPVLSVKLGEHEFLQEDGKSLRIDNILCPMDFSDFSRGALTIAADLANEHNARLVLSHVVDARFEYPEWTAQVALNNSEHLLNGAREQLEHVSGEFDGIETKVHVERGVPHRVLMNLVKEENIDLVVMPTHGRKGLAHALLGSITEKVVRTVPCPVMTIRPQG